MALMWAQDHIKKVKAVKGLENISGASVQPQPHYSAVN